MSKPLFSAPTKFEATLKMALREHSEEEIRAWFIENFDKQLDHIFLTDEKVPAETVRQKRIQNQVVLTRLLTLKKST